MALFCFVWWVVSKPRATFSHKKLLCIFGGIKMYLEEDVSWKSQFKKEDVIRVWMQTYK